MSESPVTAAGLRNLRRTRLGLAIAATVWVGGAVYAQERSVQIMQVDLLTGLLDLSLLDVERIEVLRGPQGTLYGGGAIGGTIRYITTKPNLTETQAEFGSTLSSTGHGGVNYGASATFNAPLVTDRVAFRGSIEVVRSF